MSTALLIPVHSCDITTDLDSDMSSESPVPGIQKDERFWFDDGTIVLIGGFSNGGYINRNYPNVDPAYEGGAATPTYEFYPANGRQAQVMNFLIKTSGLNAYAHTYLMPSGKMLVQANYSTSRSFHYLLYFLLTDSLTMQCSGILKPTRRLTFPTCPIRLSAYTLPLVVSRCFH